MAENDDYTLRRTLSTARFIKSLKSAAAGHCVEVAYVDGSVAVRDSKDAGGPVLMFSEDEWTAFLDGASKGEFDLPVIVANAVPTSV